MKRIRMLLAERFAGYCKIVKRHKSMCRNAKQFPDAFRPKEYRTPCGCWGMEWNGVRPEYVWDFSEERYVPLSWRL